MPRYINLDEAIKHLQFDCKAKYPLSYCNGISVAISEIGKLPTADVVPKSEYDWVVSAVDNSTKEFLKLHDDYQRQLEKNAKLHSQMAKYQFELQNAKAEVAMDIIEDLEKSCSFSVMTCNEREIPETKVYNISSLKLTELKKKYTEENV